MLDSQIIDLYFERNELAIAETQKSYGNYCYSVAWRILYDKQDADECVNDTWLRAWNTIPPTRPGRLAIFLGTITRNLSLDCYKRKQAAKRGNGETAVALEELEECISSGGSVEDIAETEELQKLINQFLHTLPEKECNVFLRRYWYVEDYETIAKRYGMKLNTVKTSLFRTRSKLKIFLEKEGIRV